MEPSAFIKDVPSWTPGRIREFLGGKDHTEYNLIDVRQQAEYEQGHLPGARLIPLGELLSRINEIDRTKPTIVY
jgi:sulfur-carrier protein adenylyltransferase/sulfurtransferase